MPSVAACTAPAGSRVRPEHRVCPERERPHRVMAQSTRFRSGSLWCQPRRAPAAPASAIVGRGAMVEPRHGLRDRCWSGPIAAAGTATSTATLTLEAGRLLHT